MRNEAKISVVIPAYNAERTLERCVQSLQSQTVHDIVIIIVDDGSTDKTPEIADALSSTDERVMTIHKQNGGCYLARLSGVEQVHTPYFGFVDADDWVEPNMYERMLSLAEDKDLDIVECGLAGKKSEREDKDIPELYLSRETVVSDYIYPRMLIGRGSNTVWNKVYKKELFKDGFQRGFFSTWEDLIWNLQLFASADRVGVLHEGLYHYEITAASSVRNFNVRNIEGLVNTIAARKCLAARFGVGENDKSLSLWIVNNTKNMLLSAAVAPVKSVQERKRNVDALLSLAELKDALAALGIFHGKESVFIWIARLLPSPIMILFIRLLRRIGM